MAIEPPPASFSLDLVEDAASRLREAIALLEMIEDGDMLCELPANPDGKARHQRAVSVLSVLKRDLVDLERRLGAGWAAAAATARAAAAARPPRS